MSEIVLAGGQVAYVDEADFEHLDQHRWYAYADTTTYAIRYIYHEDKTRQTVFMHREIMDAQPNQEVMTMSGKYMDLYETIADDMLIRPDEVSVSRCVLEWLDEHPDQVPGRTMTRSDMVEAFGEEYAEWATSRLARIGYTIVPDPEPTNVDRLKALYMEWKREGPTALDFAEWMDVRGVKAPGDDGEH